MNRRTLLAILPMALVPSNFRSLRLCSCDENDRGYSAWLRAKAEGKDIKVFLNGVEYHGVGLADEALGYIEGLQGDIGGEVVRADGPIVIGRVYGHVRIELRSKT